jgi:hypothetical protein
MEHPVDLEVEPESWELLLVVELVRLTKVLLVVITQPLLTMVEVVVVVLEPLAETELAQTEALEELEFRSQ